MATATISHQDLQENYAAAEEATHVGPVFITRDGEARAVLIEISEYLKITGTAKVELEPQNKSLADLLAVPEDEYFDWEPPRLRGRLLPLDEESECTSSTR